MIVSENDISSNGSVRGLLSGKNISRHQLNDTSYKDVSFGVIFIVNTLIIFALSVVYGPTSAESSPDTVTVTDDMETISLDNESIKLIGGMFFLAFISFVLSFSWMVFMTKYSHKVVYGIMVLVVCLILSVSIILLAHGAWLFGSLVGIFLVAIVLMFIKIQPRIYVAAINLKVACSSIVDMPVLYVFAVIVLSAQLLWCLIWVMAAYGVSMKSVPATYRAPSGYEYSVDDCTSYSYEETLSLYGQTLMCEYGTCKACGCSTFIERMNDMGSIIYTNKECYTQKMYIWKYIGMLLSGYWACAVFANVLHCATAGAIAVWWSWSSLGRPQHQENAWNSFFRAISTSFGSICLGSLLIAVVKTIRTVVYFITEQMRLLAQMSAPVGSRAAGDCVTCVCSASNKLQLALYQCMAMLLRWIEVLLEYFNRYALCYVAIYGHSFFDAAESVMALFRDRGWTAIINDDIIDFIILLCSVTIGLVVMAVGYFVAGHFFPEHTTSATQWNYSFLMISGFFFGVLMSLATLKILSSAVTTIFVCFAENPDMFQAAHPDLYNELMDAWMGMYPDQMRGAAAYQSLSPIDKDDEEHGHGMLSAIERCGDGGNESGLTAGTGLMYVPPLSTTTTSSSTPFLPSLAASTASAPGTLEGSPLTLGRECEETVGAELELVNNH